MRVLNIVISIGETSAPYNEHCLPWADKREISICTYFPTTAIQTPKSIRLFDGDGTMIGFFRAVRLALAEKEYDAIHLHSPHVALLFQLASRFSPRKLPDAKIMTVHDSFYNFRPRNRLMLLPVFASYPSVICCSHASYQSVPRLYKWVAGKRLGVVQNGLDIDRVDRAASAAVQAKNKEKAQRDTFSLVAISRLMPVKNTFTVLAAFEESAEAHSRLTYIGAGVLRDQLLAKRDAGQHAEKIDFTGLIPRDQVFSHLLNADLFISASHGEGLPIAVLEAMACGCPVLLSDIPPHREIAQHGDFIPVVPENDVNAFAREIRRFQAMSQLERKAIGQKCRAVVEKHFSLTAMHAGYTKLYEQGGATLTRPRVVTE